MRPLPNLLFTRDSSVWLPGGVAVGRLALPARQRESTITAAIYRHHPRFAGKRDPLRRRRRGRVAGGRRRAVARRGRAGGRRRAADTAGGRGELRRSGCSRRARRAACSPCRSRRTARRCTSTRSARWSTATPSSCTRRSRVGLAVALVGATQPGPSASVLLPSSHCSRSAVTGSRPVSITRSSPMPIARAAAAQERLRAADARRRLDDVRPRACRATCGYMTTASRSTIVQTVSRCIVARSCAIGTASTVARRAGREQPLRERLDARRARALADADGEHARREHEHVAALEPRLVARRCRRRAARCRRSAGGGGRSRR